MSVCVKAQDCVSLFGSFVCVSKHMSGACCLNTTLSPALLFTCCGQGKNSAGLSVEHGCSKHFALAEDSPPSLWGKRVLSTRQGLGARRGEARWPCGGPKSWGSSFKGFGNDFSAFIYAPINIVSIM